MSEVKLLLGDSRELLKTLPDNSLDACICDPPYMIGFMGKAFDHVVGNIAADPTFWAEVMRVIKPGGYLAAFGGTRTYHRLACAIEDAGWEIRDQIQWLYGSGFPKSLNVSKALDKDALDLKPQSTGFNHAGGKENCAAQDNSFRASYGYKYAPVTDAAKEWEGWGTALKPANEPICIARKPLSESSVAANVLRWETGGINIDACRVEGGVVSGGGASAWAGELGGLKPVRSEAHSAGRWPPNVLLDSAMAQEMDKQSGVSQSNAAPRKRGQAAFEGGWREAQEDTPMHGDSGGASRFFPVLDYGPEDEQGWPDDVVPFFYTAKPAQSERHAGCDDLKPSAKKVKMRDDLTPEQREYVMRELEAAGVRT